MQPQMDKLVDTVVRMTVASMFRWRFQNELWSISCRVWLRWFVRRINRSTSNDLLRHVRLTEITRALRHILLQQQRENSSRETVRFKL